MASAASSKDLGSQNMKDMGNILAPQRTLEHSANLSMSEDPPAYSASSSASSREKAKKDEHDLGTSNNKNLLRHIQDSIKDLKHVLIFK